MPEAPVPPEKDPNDWHNWSDGEVMGRLLRRGCDPVACKGWIRDRETEWGQEMIEEGLAIQIMGEDGKPIRLEHEMDRRSRPSSRR